MEKKKKEKKKISLSNRDYFLKKIDPAHHQKAMALWPGFGFSNPKPGQSHHEATFTARLGLAYLGLAWPGSWPQAGPGTSLVVLIGKKEPEIVQGLPQVRKTTVHIMCQSSFWRLSTCLSESTSICSDLSSGASMYSP